MYLVFIPLPFIENIQLGVSAHRDCAGGDSVSEYRSRGGHSLSESGIYGQPGRWILDHRLGQKWPENPAQTRALATKRTPIMSQTTWNQCLSLVLNKHMWIIGPNYASVNWLIQYNAFVQLKQWISWSQKAIINPVEVAVARIWPQTRAFLR